MRRSGELVMQQVCVMGWLQLVGSLKSYVSFAKEPYKNDDILRAIDPAGASY